MNDTGAQKDASALDRNLKIGSLILAGGKIEGQRSGDPDKGFLDIDGRPMVSLVSAALLATGRFSRIIVMASESADLADQGIDGVEVVSSQPAATLPDKLSQGLTLLGGTGHVLIVASDIPLITADAVRDFVDRSLDSGGDVCYPMIRRQDVESRFPGTKRTWIKLRDGVFTGGNLMLVRAEVVLVNVPLVNQLIDMRKKPVGLVRLLGLGFLFKLLLSRLSIADIERRFSKIIGAPGRIIISSYPEIGVDIDKIDDLELIEHELVTSARQD